MADKTFLNILELTWKPLLEKAENNPESELDLLSKAITIISRYHPLFHFFESGLNTELALLYMKQGRKEEAIKAAKRALFLEHENQTAKVILDESVNQPPPYAAAPNDISDWLDSPSEESIIIFEQTKKAAKLAAQGNIEESIKAYKKSIELTEREHQKYHIEAAKPWIKRAEYFKKQGEEILEKNDRRRAHDLDPSVDVG